ncbi:carboxymuconolactone decarboxylase family protein [Thalassobacillus sp. C254]|uniref:carboxymuconolactone decarboxylase family protein n=1 Tax=Thalassobacillus sp. C254 TaxID=1225341 RepID=UPI0006CFC080|nr:carboxymuconolactone decarboxylase family protein [Thalassobacillus sp. C254]
MTEALYDQSYFSRIREFSQLSPESFQAFIHFDQSVMESGILSVKLKELTAVAVAHTTGCPYCIEVHVGNLKEAGGTKEEMSEAIFVATALKAGSAAAHGVNALNAYDGESDGSLYKKEYFARIKEFSDLSGESFASFIDFDQKALKEGALTVKEKELIAVAVAHTTGCPYCIEVHIEGARKAGAIKEEVAEVIMVATALKAGSALAHGVNALNSFDS